MSKPLVKPSTPFLNKAHPLSKGLVACYPFQDKVGTTARDISGKNRNGTLTNMDPATDWVKTPYGYGLAIEGNQYIDCGNFTESTGEISHEIWFKCSAVTSYWHLFWWEGTNYSYVSIDSSGNIWFLTDGNGGSYAKTSSPNYIDGLWHNLFTTTRNNSTAYIFVDGIKKETTGTADSGTISTSGAFKLGGRNNAGQVGTGIIVNPRLYNRQLSAKIASQLYTNPWEMYRKPLLNRYGKMITAPTKMFSMFD